MMNTPKIPGFIPRAIAQHMRTLMALAPVVLVRGPRQCGKSTLVRSLLELDRAPVYFNLDDAQVFAALRANDLIWPYVISGYLKGKAPPAFDLLFWNSDDSNLPGPMFCWYLRNTYLENKLREPGATIQCGVPVDLKTIEIPAFLYGSREDHIVPWQAAYASSRLLGGKVTFVLGGSGHIAGVINPPAKNKRNHWIGKVGPGPEDWLKESQDVPGSWWPKWIAWLKPHAGAMRIAPKKLGNRQFAPIEAAPGRYVKAKAP